MDGELSATSQPGAGSTFRLSLRLPADPPPPRIAQRLEAEPLAAPAYPAARRRSA